MHTYTTVPRPHWEVSAFGLPADPFTLISVTLDGTVHVWDLEGQGTKFALTLINCFAPQGTGRITASVDHFGAAKLSDLSSSPWRITASTSDGTKLNLSFEYSM